ncbi:MAG TPA: phosphodiesterase [Spirochaetia bacterium]|nr:phosphodiesterase [Spirochaetia bacterium]
MRIGIVSDTHGDVVAWQDLTRGIFRGVDLIVHAGDILYHGPRNRLSGQYDPSALANLINTGPVPVLFARGNCDAEVDQLLLEYPILSPYLFLQVEGLRVLANHGHDLDREGLLAMARRYRVHLMVSGHTHLPRLEEEGGIVLLNPGSPALPKGGFPSAAVLDGAVISIYDLLTNGVVTELEVKNGR